MPAPRRRIRRNWPTGLYESVVKGTTYYRWLDPITKAFRGLGTDFETARNVATLRNQALAKPLEKKYLDRLDGISSITFRAAVEAFLRDVMARETGRGEDVYGRSEQTLRDYRGYCQRFRNHFGDETPLAALDLRQISDYLTTYGDKNRARNVARGLLIQIWTLAVSKGWAPKNYPADTLKVQHAVQRKRLTVEQFESLASTAEPWFNAALRFALYCDQRRGDLADVPASDWDGERLVVDQSKTGHLVRITAGPLLKRAIKDCIACGAKNVPTIIRKPGRSEPVSADMLTKEFARVRDKLIMDRDPAWSGFKRTSPGKPTWHELRSLGGVLAEIGKKDQKALAGHATAEMVRLYQQGHRRIFEADSL